MTLFLVVVEDRHVDTEIVPFDCERSAIAYAEGIYASEIERRGAFATTRPPPVSANTLWSGTYSSEGDCIHVERVELRDCAGHAPETPR